jgi:ATP-dependent RNA helicase DDX56/DBP9
MTTTREGSENEESLIVEESFVSDEEVEKDFNSLGLDARLVCALSRMGGGIENPTLIQAQAIPLALSGRDILARAPTGSGKTLAYVLPVLHKILNGIACGGGACGGSSGVEALILVPTKELAMQVTQVIDVISRFCSQDSLRVCNLAGEDSLSLQQAALQATRANLLVSTPSRILPHLSSGLVSLSSGQFQTLVLDEADLILSFGFQSDLDLLVAHLPKLFQTLLFSATLSDDLNDLKALLLHAPVILKVADEVVADAELATGRVLKQYSIPAGGDDKFLFTYVTLKLNLLRGKILIFCNSTDRAYKLKLYLDQFGVKCAVLNPELPLLSRHGIVDQFNRSVFNVLIAADDSSSDTTREGCVARGVDFKRVDVVFNFDFPASLAAYTHRVGRTARGKDGRGTALSLIDVEADSGAAIESVRSAVHLTDFPFPMGQLEAFRYRSLDALRSTTKAAVKRARATELSKQILASQKLSTGFFSGRPQDLQMLRNDAAIRGKAVRIQTHMKHVPGYLLSGVGARESQQSKSQSKSQAEEVASHNGETGNETGNFNNDHDNDKTANVYQNNSESTGLFETKKQKRFHNEASTLPAKKKKSEPQTIVAPEHLKLPQTAPETRSKPYRPRGSFNKKGIKRNNPLKSGKLMN